MGAVADGAAQGGAGHRMVGDGAVADQQDGARLLEHGQGAGGVADAGARPGGRERDARRLDGAVVDVVGAEHGAEELLRLVGLLVGTHRRDEAGDAPGADPAELLGDQVERLVPARLDEHAVAADERVLQARALVRLQHGEPATLAQPAAIGRHVTGAGDLDDLAVLEVHHRLAAHAAVRAGGTDALQLPVSGDAFGGALRHAPTGQASTHWPHSSHWSRSGSGYQSLPPARSARRPEGCGTTPWTWMAVQAAQQRPQRMHLE